MVVDNASHTVFLFGGWDGSRDLADFWTYHVPSRKWSLVLPVRRSASCSTGSRWWT